jgi:DNA-binding NarL/FixJ family response regulator
LPGLTEREVEILRLLTRGHSKGAIARQLFISETTARHHVEHIYDKLGVSTRAGAVMQAVARGLADELSAE